MEVRGEQQIAAEPQGRVAASAAMAVPVFDWLDALMALLAVYAVGGLACLVEVNFNGRFLAAASIPVVIWAVRTRRKLFPGAARYVRDGFSWLGLLGMLLMGFGFVFGAFGGSELFQLSQMQPAPVEQWRYDMAVSSLVLEQQVGALRDFQVEEVQGVAPEAALSAGDLLALEFFAEPSEQEMQRAHALAVAEVEAENLADFAKDKTHKQTVVLWLLGLGVAGIGLGGMLDALRTRRSEEMA